MQDITTKLEESRSRVVRQGTAFFEQSTDAAGAFVEKTRKAGRRFGDDTRKAGQALAGATRTAGVELADGLRTEAQLWRDTLLTVVPAPMLAADASGPRVPTKTALERELLLRVERLLQRFAGEVHSRVEQLDVLVGPQLPAEVPSSVSAKGTKASATSPGTVAAVVPPLSNYDELSAKDIVARLERLSDEKTAAVHAYELATKKRATVLRAAELRLAAEA